MPWRAAGSTAPGVEGKGIRCAAEDREYWLRVLAAGGNTAVPRWATDPATGHRRARGADPGRRGRAGCAADGSDVPLGSLLLAAHAAVLAALSGERDVVTGYVAEAGRAGRCPVRCRSSRARWRELLHAHRRAEEELLAHADFPVEELRATGLTGPRSDAVFGHAATSPTTRCCGWGSTNAEGPALRLRYRTDVLDAAAAARIAGYHLTALHRLVTEPDAELDRHSLLSAAEIAFQIDGLAGPHRELPEQRFHELFEQRVRQHPDAVAAEHAGRRWTYRELNARANRIGRALLARGLAPRGRGRGGHRAQPGLDGLGHRDLQGRRRLPADRAAPARATGSPPRCAAPSATSCSPKRAAPPPSTRPCRAARRAAGAGRDRLRRAPRRRRPRRRRSAPDQLAYIYFTSGSTGEPKGAMCEHAGMLNHLHAKIADLEIGEGQTVAQTAPQSFDISLWQLISALLVGGRTLLVPQDVDPRRRPVRRHHRRRPGQRGADRAVLPRGRADLPGAEPRPLPDLHCVLGHRRGAQAGARPALVRASCRGSSSSTPTG